MSGKQKKLKWVLLPFALLYSFVIGFRNKLFDYEILRSREFDIPIISVGNITIGGTGKTPHVEYLVSILKEQFKVATLSRGYKRKSKGFILADESSGIHDIGDEPKQIRRKFPDIQVAVDNKRVNGIQKLVSKDFAEKLEVIILDDAFQHRYVTPGINILLIDYNRPLSEDFMLPVGTLRERDHYKSRADIIIMTKSPRNIKPIEQRIILKRLNVLPYQSLYFTTFCYNKIIPVFENANSRKITLKDDKPSVLLVTGIAHSTPLIEYIDTHAKVVNHLKFKDHYVYTKNDLKNISDAFEAIDGSNKIVITTEKDAVRLQENEYISNELRAHLFFVPIEIEFLKEQDKAFNNQIIKYVKKNKRKY